MDAEKRNFDMLRQKAKLKWALEGDENTRLFHATIRKKARANELRSPQANAKWIEEPSRLNEEVKAFFNDGFV